MKFQFSEDMWEKISLLWNREKMQDDDNLDYSDVQVKAINEDVVSGEKGN